MDWLYLLYGVFAFFIASPVIKLVCLIKSSQLSSADVYTFRLFVLGGYLWSVLYGFAEEKEAFNIYADLTAFDQLLSALLSMLFLHIAGLCVLIFSAGLLWLPDKLARKKLITRLGLDENPVMDNLLNIHLFQTNVVFSAFWIIMLYFFHQS